MTFYTHVEHSPTKTIYIKYYTETQTHALNTHTHTHTHTMTNTDNDKWQTLHSSWWAASIRFAEVTSDVSNLVFKYFNAHSTSTVISGQNTFCHSDAADLQTVKERLPTGSCVKCESGNVQDQTDARQKNDKHCTVAAGLAASIWSCRCYTRCLTLL